MNNDGAADSLAVTVSAAGERDIVASWVEARNAKGEAARSQISGWLVRFFLFKVPSEKSLNGDRKESFFTYGMWTCWTLLCCPIEYQGAGFPTPD